ncbi:N-acetylglucosamine-specific PTS transporter subunit IIBC [Vibrio tapetis]|uniref:PTS system N-acetylglucosamine-specific EIICB component n=1 Tax=Vibrio tapetis subsp. tapetis TaxID=1671868 RepID=A0A2N8ZHB2_9VIBR|nr:N-acetylglucosamine-specific PTS transporter subunit IIBC [Vibrio tapetis]SON51289.1 PTS system N-acetylglucosamine-specific EIICB component [Includes: N-acetylglucosamine permease IIC component; N-acetylglucosamine-specific phosphotransferase enzyme IIB component] [Vibrio tapetis subsp. tapetis]
MNILGYLQKIGKALMVPIAVLPAGGLMLGLGYAIDPSGWGANSALATILVYGGKGIMDNQAWLFAVGVAYGLAKDNNGAAALSGLLGLLIIEMIVGNVAVISQITGVPVDQMSSSELIASKASVSAFTGIVIGIVAATLYNRFHTIKLPAVLGFFGGRRFVPIVTSLSAIAISLVMVYVWPAVYGALVDFGIAISEMGAAGAGLYGFFNRLLIPVGLHHALNQVFIFDLVGINDISKFWSSTGELGVTGIYQGGFFPVMGYGLPAACLAMYHCAKPENKKKVGGILGASALTAILTGVTEPIEFAFMFVAPVLYVIHAFLAALSLYIAASMQWIAGFTFSGGLIDFVLSFNLPLAVKPYMLIVQGLCFAAIYYFIFRFAILKFDLKTPGREDKEVAEIDKLDTNEKAAQYLKALGGHENLTSIDSCITRLRLTLKDTSIANESMLKAIGAMGIVKMGDNNLQVIIGTEAEEIAHAMKQIPKDEDLTQVPAPNH